MFRDGLRLNSDPPVDARTGAVSAGQLLKFDGTSIVGTSAAGAQKGTATLDFGATPAETASVAVTGQTWVGAASQIKAFFMKSTTADNGADEHEEGGTMCPLVVGSIVNGVGFTIYANPISSYGIGQFTVGWLGS